MFHDSLGCVALWRDFPAQLAQITGRRVIAYDRLGFGQSDPYPGPLPLSFVSDEAAGTFQTLYQTLELERITSPLLAMHGDQDEYGSSAHPERMLAHTKGTALMKILPNCGHVPHREQTDTVFKLIQDFLENRNVNHNGR